MQKPKLLFKGIQTLLVILISIRQVLKDDYSKEWVLPIPGGARNEIEYLFYYETAAMAVRRNTTCYAKYVSVGNFSLAEKVETSVTLEGRNVSITLNSNFLPVQLTYVRKTEQNILRFNPLIANPTKWSNTLK